MKDDKKLKARVQKLELNFADLRRTLYQLFTHALPPHAAVQKSRTPVLRLLDQLTLSSPRASVRLEQKFQSQQPLIDRDNFFANQPRPWIFKPSSACAAKRHTPGSDVQAHDRAPQAKPAPAVVAVGTLLGPTPQSPLTCAPATLQPCAAPIASLLHTVDPNHTHHCLPFEPLLVVGQSLPQRKPSFAIQNPEIFGKLGHLVDQLQLLDSKLLVNSPTGHYVVEALARDCWAQALQLVLAMEQESNA